MQLNARLAAQTPHKKPFAKPSIMSRSRSAVLCTHCGDPVIMPEWSEWVDAGYARHLWHCDTCDYSFETRVVFAAA